MSVALRMRENISVWLLLVIENWVTSRHERDFCGSYPNVVRKKTPPPAPAEKSAPRLGALTVTHSYQECGGVIQC